jgi:quercetin dioxygenase-like cupin family protein
MDDQTLYGTAVRPGEGRTWQVLNDRVTVKLGSAQTQGAFALFFDQVPPGGKVPTHSHGGQETFMMVEGELQFRIQQGAALNAVTATVGTVIHIPAGAAHDYRNVSAATAAFFVLFTPAGASERFFERLGVPVPGPDDPPAQTQPEVAIPAALMEEFGVHLEPTPPREQSRRSGEHPA